MIKRLFLHKSHKTPHCHLRQRGVFLIRKLNTSNLFRNKVNYFFLLVYCILHGLPRSTVFVFYIENHQIASVNHISISRLVCSFGIYLFIRVVHIDFVTVCSVALHTVVEFGSENLQKRYRTELFAYAKLLAVAELKGAWSDKVL